MENASKALLIAGSVLIAILLIAFGMKIFNSTSGTASQLGGTMQTIEMATFNSKFTQYVGTGKSRSQVMSLLNQIIANNATNTLHPVKVNTSNDIASKMNSLVEGKYSISIDSTGGYTNGYVSNITIKNSAGNTI